MAEENPPAPADDNEPEKPAPPPESPAPAPEPEPAPELASEPEPPAPAPEPEPEPEPAPVAHEEAIEPEENMSDSDSGIFTLDGAADTRNAENVYAAGDVVAYVAALGTTPPVGFTDLSASVWGCLGWLDTAGGIFNLNHTTKDIGAAGTLSSIRTIFTGGNKTLQVTCLEALNPLARALYDDVPLENITPLTRVDPSCGTTSTSVTVTDTAAAATDVGATVTGTGIPLGTTIVSVIAGTSFHMSAAATATGSVAVTVQAANSEYVIPEVPLDNRYALVLDSIDGNNQIRMFAPMAKVTTRGNDQIQQGDSENLQLTFTLFPASITLNGVTTRGSLARYINYAGLVENFAEQPQISVNP